VETFCEGMATEDIQTDGASALIHLAESYLNGTRVEGASSSLGEKYQVFLYINANAANLDWKVNQEHCLKSIVSRALSHALRIRDAGCRYPGCTQNHYTDSHHIKHWAQGGETSMENLVTLCRFHHGLLHKGEYRLARDESGDLVITNNRNEIITQSFYPQFQADPCAGDCLAPSIDEHRAKSKWHGDSMDIQYTLQCMFQTE
jgi:hypothetical protein